MHEHERLKYTLEASTTGKNTGAYIDCILLIIFKHFPIDDNMDKLKGIAKEYSDKVLEIWVMNEIRNSGKYQDLCIKII